MQHGHALRTGQQCAHFQAFGRLVRAQHGERRRSGTLRRFDARVLATTNRDLSPLVQKGAFRADLWARLRDCRLYVPALRERQEDIPELLSLFAARAAQKAGKRMPLISSGLRRQAQTYHWPANLIELENCAHRALMFAKNLTLEPDPCLVSPQRLSDVLREHILHVLETKINLFELVVGELDMILGRVDDEFDFETTVFDAFVASEDDAEFGERMAVIGDDLARARTDYLASRASIDNLVSEEENA